MNPENINPNNLEQPDSKWEATEGSIRVIIERGKQIKPQEFLNFPPKSIALDGYCDGQVFDFEAQRYSFDHHAGVNRHAARATSEQVFHALLADFSPEDFNIYVNDLDGDTILSVWLLQNSQMINQLMADQGSESKLKLEKLYQLVDSAGVSDNYGPHHRNANPQLARIFFEHVLNPLNESYKKKEYRTADLNALLQQCLSNMDAAWEKDFNISLPEREAPKPFKVLYTGDGFVIAESQDMNTEAVYNDKEKGAKCAILVKPIPLTESKSGELEWGYRIAKSSEFVPVPLGPGDKPGTILYNLAQKETGWGGGSTIGAFRDPTNKGLRSKLSPEQIYEVVTQTIEERQKKVT